VGTGDSAAAEAQTATACGIVDRLIAKDPHRPEWRGGLRDCWTRRARLALAANRTADAASAAERAVDIGKSVKTSDPVSDSYLLASAYLVLGDALRASNDLSGASEAWSSGLAVLPPAAAERPPDTKEHALLLERLGRDSAQLRQRLSAIGYRNTLL
jgi:tetratricopeptide (TPR) repeat protein